MQIELLKEIVSVISGPTSIDIVDLLHKKKNVNEFLIAKKLNITINQARNILYKLAPYQQKWPKDQTLGLPLPTTSASAI